MVFFAIDDEQRMLDELQRALVEAEPHARVHAFKSAQAALKAMDIYGEIPDVVFSDIELPEMNGLVFAEHMREFAPTAKLVFVTEHPGYALEAYRIHANGFVVKPVDAQRIREELDHLFPSQDFVARAKLRVRCFGNFDVFVGNDPLVFGRQRTKELLAILVDRVGGTCTGGEIITALWEGEGEKSHQSYLRVLTSDLRKTLDTYGFGDALIHAHGQWALRKDYVDCDYYRLLEGDPAALDAYHGEYMKQYSWAEDTNAYLHFSYGI